MLAQSTMRHTDKIPIEHIPTDRIKVIFFLLLHHIIKNMQGVASLVSYISEAQSTTAFCCSVFCYKFANKYRYIHAYK